MTEARQLIELCEDTLKIAPHDQSVKSALSSLYQQEAAKKFLAFPEDSAAWREASSFWSRASELTSFSFPSEVLHLMIEIVKTDQSADQSDSSEIQSWIASHLQLIETETLVKRWTDIQAILSRVRGEEGSFNALASLLMSLSKYEEAEKILEIALSRFPRSRELTIMSARANTCIGRHASFLKAKNLWRSLLNKDPNDLEALKGVGLLWGGTGGLSGMKESLEALKRYVELKPDDAEVHLQLSELMSELDLIEESGSHLSTALSLNSNLDDTRAKDLADFKARDLTKRKKIKVNRYPDANDILNDLRGVIIDSVIGNLAQHEPFISASSRFFTMGSCFAGNVAKHLGQQKYNVRYLPVVEEVNSSYANRYITEWLSGSLSGELKERMDDLMKGQNRDEWIQYIKESDVVIYTLGVAPSFFERQSGNFVLPRPSKLNQRTMAEIYEQRTTTVQENVSNVSQVISYLRSLNPLSTICLTVSPVSLIASFEFSSAVQADCLSKSVMRVAAHELMNKGIERMIYWPSFEIVRWLGAHMGPVYGAHDGCSVHVNEELVALITGLFIETFTGQLSKEQ